MKFFCVLFLELFTLWTVFVSAQDDNAMCYVNGMAYYTLQKTPDPCDRCVCQSGTIVCNTKPCTREWMTHLRRLKDEGWLPRFPWDGTFDNVTLER